MNSILKFFDIIYRSLLGEKARLEAEAFEATQLKTVEAAISAWMRPYLKTATWHREHTNISYLFVVNLFRVLSLAALILRRTDEYENAVALVVPD